MLPFTGDEPLPRALTTPVQDAREDSPLTTTAATAFRASIAERRIAVDFGRTRPRASAGDEVTMDLSNRIVIDADAARRLISALNVCVRSHEARWGALTADAGAAAASRAPTPSHAEPDEAGQQAALLFRLVGSLGAPYSHERSFRITDHSLAANRFLLTVNRRSVPGDYRQAITGLCRQLAMPAALQKMVERNIAGARSAHFGFEGDESILFKVYLELANAREQAAGAEPGTPVPLHVAFKWDTRDPQRRVVSRYLWYPKLTVAQVEARMAQIYRGSGNPQSLEIARSVLEHAAGSMNPEDLQYLEVMEDGNDRLSFDLNLYDAGLRVKDLQAQLVRMREQFSIRPGQFQALYDQIKSKAVGHLAGGIHRNGRDFFNVYYGVEECRG